MTAHGKPITHPSEMVLVASTQAVGPIVLTFRMDHGILPAQGAGVVQW
jgi:hypothetical protein